MGTHFNGGYAPVLTAVRTCFNGSTHINGVLILWQGFGPCFQNIILVKKLKLQDCYRQADAALFQYTAPLASRCSIYIRQQESKLKLVGDLNPPRDSTG